ncbi:hypothetical protein H4R21_002308 [Coemansia helicoidea]|uniref:Uncharacterized protein n=1 Tax=Coemansia helicoidea TaxID=1286919 RepID=A0ACC1L722_9FUNG|nr:hypothetical protein H4R21_002308 [Coemansia helicoidea]
MEAAPEITAAFKLLFVGDSNVGKSSILLRFTDDLFRPPDETSATIGVDFKVHMHDVDGERYKLLLWDTAGQERFRTLTSSYYRGVHGVILVYDVSSRESFAHLDTWVEEVGAYCLDGDVVKMVVGNKIDKEAERQVSRQEGAEYARRLQALFLECSAKTRTGVRQAIEELVAKIIDTPELWRRGSPPKATVSIDESVAAGLGSGCAC